MGTISIKKLNAFEVTLARLAAQDLVTLPTQQPLKKVRLAKISGIPISKVFLDDRR